MEKLIDDIFASQPNEIQCDEAAIQMVHCYSANLSDADSQKQYPQLWHHFRFCPDCTEEYEMMMAMAQLAATGKMVQPDKVPPVPDAPTWWQRLKEAITITFPGFEPNIPAAMQRGKERGVEREIAAGVQRDSDTGFEPVTLPLIPDTLFLDIDVALNDDTSLRDIFCTIWAEDAELETAFEGSSIWLQTGESHTVLQEEAFNDAGDVTLSFVQPGLYDLGLSIAGQSYLVQGVTLP